MEREDTVKELAQRLREAYLAGKAAERPFDQKPPSAPPPEPDHWHH